MNGERARDIITIALTAIGVLAILAISGALGWVEAVTAGFVLVAATMAYYVGSTVPDDADLIGDLPLGERREPSGIDAGALLSALPFPAVHVGRDGRIGAANELAASVFRIRNGQRSLVAGVMRQPRLIDAIERTQSTGVARHLEYTMTGNTEQVWRAHVAPFSFGEEGVLVLLEDLTQARLAEKARADFLANASHELRTPLTSLAGFIETMRGPARRRGRPARGHARPHPCGLSPCSAGRPRRRAICCRSPGSNFPSTRRPTASRMSP
jgi:two-component system, OmpR family, phosphate regulon sensor histidine kinase PhoR